MKAPFETTSCSCPEDRASCRRQPGHLLPGQMAVIADYLKEKIEDVRGFFWNSPGMTLGNKEGERFHLRTITPKFKHGKCVFYRQGRCTIHPVAPFGCRYFDIHMSAEEGQRRAMWGVENLVSNLEDYTAERDQLTLATHHKPRGY